MTHVIVLGSGFVGSVVADRLRADDSATVSVMGISSHPELAGRDEVGRAMLLAEIERTGALSVINTSGLLRGTPDQMHSANVAWPAWLTQQVLPGSGVRFVHLGSAAEYGDPGSAEPVHETATPNPSGPYGESKWAGSAAVLAARAEGLDAVVARGFNLVGPNLSAISPLHQFMSDVTALPPDGGVVEVWWPATVRDFVLTEDLAEAVARLSRVDEVPDVVNICAQVRIRFDEIVMAMAARQGKVVEIASLDRPGIPAVVGDNSRLWQVCGLRPVMSAELIAERAGL